MLSSSGIADIGSIPPASTLFEALQRQQEEEERAAAEKSGENDQEWAAPVEQEWLPHEKENYAFPTSTSSSCSICVNLPTKSPTANMKQKRRGGRKKKNKKKKEQQEPHMRKPRGRPRGSGAGRIIRGDGGNGDEDNASDLTSYVCPPVQCDRQTDSEATNLRPPQLYQEPRRSQQC
eukprot:GHVU01039740.1.p2 GENE.GHVU01039740.1~~GHVU01039740.1.p2  ORF type:complete len:177 (+),score=41.77 GHVU01039740.1:3717-4247(+)